MVDMEETETETESVETRKDCKWCDRAWGINGLLLAGIFAFAGLDLLTNGGISRFISRLFGDRSGVSDDGWTAEAVTMEEGEDE